MVRAKHRIGKKRLMCLAYLLEPAALPGIVLHRVQSFTAWVSLEAVSLEADVLTALALRI